MGQANASTAGSEPRRESTGTPDLIRCEAPELGGDAVLEDLFVSGWACVRGGARDATVAIDGVGHRARPGMWRADVTAALGLPATARQYTFDPGPVAAGEHQVGFEASSPRGERLARAGGVRIDPDEPYQRWLESIHPVRYRSGLGGVTVVVLPGPRDELFEHTLAAQGPSDLLDRSPTDLTAALEDLASRGRGCLVLVNPGGALAPEATTALARAVLAGADLAYGDEHRTGSDGSPVDGRLKPGWSPELLLAGDYIGSPIAVGPRLARAALAAGKPQNIYELLLGAIGVPLSCERIARPLVIDPPPRDASAERDAVGRLGRRWSRRLAVQAADGLPLRVLRWAVTGEPLVSVVIPTRGGPLLESCVRSIALRTAYRNLELVLVDSGATGLPGAAALADPLPTRVLRAPGPFNFSASVNLGCRAAEGSHLLVVNDDTEVVTADWVERLLEQAQTPGVGVVGCLLTYPDGHIQHAGVLTVGGGAARHYYLGRRADVPGYRGELRVARNCSAVTGACLMLDRATYEATGGLDHAFPLDYGDVDLCLRAIAAGKRVVFTPHATLVHRESSTRSQADVRAPTVLADRWAARWTEDPYYHPAFDDTHDHVIAAGNREAAPAFASVRRSMGSGASSASQNLAAGTAAPAIEFDAPPATREAMRERARQGRPVMWCEQPTLDGTVTARGEISIRGWAFAEAGIDMVAVTLDDSQTFEVEALRPRLDVATVLGRADAERSGFVLHLDVRDAQPGPHRLRVVARSGSAAVGCEGTIEIQAPQAGDEQPEPEPLSGERLVPEVAEQRLITAEHVARYRLAERLAPGRRVLDAGCGAGYGAALLARAGASSTTGLDRSPEAVLDARSRAGDIVGFVLGDLLDLPFPDGSFDLVTCFEAIEHVLEPERALDQLARVMAPGAVLVVSSPNPEAYTQGNPWHVRELRPEELNRALRARFAHVDLYGQHAHLATLLAPSAVLDRAEDSDPLDVEVRRIARAPDFLYTAAVASDTPLPPLRGLTVLADVYDHREMTETLSQFEERAIVAEADAQASRVETQIARLASDRAERRAEQAAQQADLAEQARARTAQALAVVYRSRSWRLTAAMRALRRPLR